MSTPLDILNAAFAAADATLANTLASLNIVQSALGMTGGTLAWQVSQTTGVTLSLTFASIDPNTGATADTEATGYLGIATLDGPTLQTALAGLANIGAGNVSVTGSAGGPWIVTLVGALAGSQQPIGALTGSVTGAGATITIVPFNQTTPTPGSDQGSNLTAATATFTAALDTYNTAVTSVQSDVADAANQVASMNTGVAGPLAAVNVTIATGGTPDCAAADIESGINAAVNGMISNLNTILTTLAGTLEAMKTAHQSLISAVNTFQSVQLQAVSDTEAQKAALTNQINGMFP